MAARLARIAALVLLATAITMASGCGWHDHDHHHDGHYWGHHYDH